MILIVSSEGCFSLDWNLVETPVQSYGLGRALQESAAILLRTTPGNAGLTPTMRDMIYQALARQPFYAALEPDDLRQWLASGRVETTVYDRSIGREVLADVPWLENIFVSDLTDPALPKLVLADLDSDLKAIALPVEQYRADVYWEERAKILQRSARGVSHLHYPRILNKLRYATQRDVLQAALSDYSRESKFAAIPPNLMDVGCGIGRLYPLCSTYARYVGTDISDTMIGTARTLFPRGRFFKKAELDAEILPKMDALFTVTVLHHNPPETRREIFEGFRSRCADSARIIILEDVAEPAATAVNMYPLSVRGIVDQLSSVFQSCSVVGLRTISYKPYELRFQAVLLEVEVLR